MIISIDGRETEAQRERARPESRNVRLEPPHLFPLKMGHLDEKAGCELPRICLAF